MISYIIPTRDRHGELAATLGKLAALGVGAHERIGGAEIVVIDNASRVAVEVPAEAGGIPVRVVRLGENLGAAARNVGAEACAAGSLWLVMLDDDSAPESEAFVDDLLAAPRDVAAVAADIRLIGGRRESGGLPEVFVGCGVALRRDDFLRLGGYDRSFGYYAEEYDLAARLIADGKQVVYSSRFRVTHRKVTGGRCFRGIVERLTRNNAVVVRRYAPDAHLGWMLDHTLERYERIARKEGALAGFRRGVAGLEARLADEPRTPLGERAWERFVGLAAAEAGLRWLRASGVERAALVRRGKHDWCVLEAARRAGVGMFEPGEAVGAVGRRGCRGLSAVVGTLSPGPMLDGAAASRAEGWRSVHTAWSLPARVGSAAAA